MSMKMNKKIKSFILLDVVISVFFLSIISYFMYSSIFSNKKIQSDIEERIKASNIANSIIEEIIATGSFENISKDGFKSDVKIMEIEKGLKKVEVTVKYGENEKEVKLSNCY